MRSPKKVCKIDGCFKPHRARGFCNGHYRRWQKHGNPLGGRVPNGQSTQWLKDHVGYSSIECLEWPFHVGSRGYGQIWVNGSMGLAHRTMCTLAHGEPPTEHHEAAHSCGRSACVNPNHLRWATAKSNNADKRAHGTENVGERNGNSRLTVGQIQSIRADSRNRSVIASEYGINLRTVYKIKSGRRWGWLAHDGEEA